MTAAIPLLASVWSSNLVDWVSNLGIVVLALGMLVCLHRVVRGPHLADRVLATDTTGILLIGLVVLLSIRLRTLMLFDGILVLSLLAFAGTVAMAQYIARPHIRNKTPIRKTARK